jgi:arylformamidase
MSRIVDLTMPVEDHFRWPVDRRLKSDFAKGDQFQVTWAGWTVHGFTHVDAPRHMLPDGATTSELSLDTVTGEAAVIDLTGIAPDTAIEADLLDGRGSHVRAGDIVLLKTSWDRVESPRVPEFWTRSPYMTRGASEWLRKRSPKAVGFDFPQDHPIRDLLQSVTRPISDFVTHDVLLRNGVTLIEYLCNMTEVRSARTQFFALPLKILDADGAPARVIALEP